jgi:hypothetical protein
VTLMKFYSFVVQLLWTLSLLNLPPRLSPNPYHPRVSQGRKKNSEGLSKEVWIQTGMP